MNRRYKFYLVLLIVLSVFCIFSFENNASKLNIVGSSSVQPVMEQLIEKYEKNKSSVDINVQGGGSSLGIKCANFSVADIGISSKDVECKYLQEFELGREAIVVIVNKNNPISDISSADLQKVYSGEITEWGEISNKSGKINVIVREEGSGTLDSFKSVVMVKSEIKDDALVQNSPGSVKQMVINDENAIVFVSLCHLDNNLKNISIDGIAPCRSTVIGGEYKLQRSFLLLTNQNPDNQTKEFINWAMGDDSLDVLNSQKIFRVDCDDKKMF